MSKGYSLHIGLNTIDKTKYLGDYIDLRNAENDNDFYEQLAIDNKFIVIKKLSGVDATSVNLINALKDYSEQLESGDLFFFSYSGHGSRVEDLNNDEIDELDEVLVLYDRLFLDDEFQICWSKFKLGVRIFFINDSCFNGSVSRFLELNQKHLKSIWPDNIFRGVDSKDAMIDFENNLTYFKGIKLGTSINPLKADCSIIHIGSCQDNQLSEDGLSTDRNGKFTLAFRKIYDEGNFKGSYKAFFDSIKAEMPPWQTPSWDLDAGRVDEEFIKSTFLVF